MAIVVNINDIASQLNTASRLVVSTDFFWIYTANGSQVKLPAEFVRAYLVNGIKPSINANGNWEIDGKDLGVVAKGKTPQFRGGTMGIEVSYDEGRTWTQAVAYTDMDPDLAPLAEAYTKVTQGEADRQKAENTRNSNEAAREKAENSRASVESARASAETKREADFATSKKACDDATSASKTQTAACRTATDNANTQASAAQNAANAANTSRANIEKNEAARQKAETDRGTSETTRQTQETARQNAETQRAKAESSRNSNETARKTAETQRQKDTATAITNSKTQTDLAQELNEHPPKMGENGNWWRWNLQTHAYEDTGIIARGGAMYPTFSQSRNKLLMIDYGSNISEHVVKRRNKLVIKV